MQLPIDGIYHNVTMTGVPVILTAIDSNGNHKKSAQPQPTHTMATMKWYGPHH